MKATPDERFDRILAKLYASSDRDAEEYRKAMNAIDRSPQPQRHSARIARVRRNDERRAKNAARLGRTAIGVERAALSAEKKRQRAIERAEELLPGLRASLEAARAEYARKFPESARDRAMAATFPLGTGGGGRSRRAREKELDRTINRATKSLPLIRGIMNLEARIREQEAILNGGRL